MPTLPSNPSKQTEIDYWRQFVAALPDSYLRSMFRGSEDYIEGMIRNDFAYDPIPELRAKADDLRNDVKNLLAQKIMLTNLLSEMEAKKKQAERDTNRAKDELEDIKKAARRIMQG